eukprot:SAG31_NODE_19902_length_588_cov_21.693252_1_plen_129_part_00
MPPQPLAPKHVWSEEPQNDGGGEGGTKISGTAGTARTGADCVHSTADTGPPTGTAGTDSDELFELWVEDGTVVCEQSNDSDFEQSLIDFNSEDDKFTFIHTDTQHFRQFTVRFDDLEMAFDGWCGTVN